MAPSSTLLLVKLTSPIPIHAPLPVSASSPLPVVLPTPLDVHITGGVPDWVAYLTLIVAVITLAAVGYQILLARNELNYVKQDLDNQHEQMREFRRRPKLSLNLRLAETSLSTDSNAVTTETVCFRLWCQNSGTLSTKEFRVRIFFPVGQTVLIDGNGFPADVGGEQYRARDFVQFDKRLYPDNEVRVDGTFTVRFTDPFVALWEIDDEYGHYPERYLGAMLVTAINATATELPDNAKRKSEEILARQRADQGG